MPTFDAGTRPPGGLAVRTPAQLRDIPRSCSCVWEWNAKTRRWVLAQLRVSCAWHCFWKRGLIEDG